MAQLVIDAPVLRIEGLELKYDVVPASGSLELILGSALEAKIVQQLHFWTRLESNGIFYKGLRWIYKSIRELIEEVLPVWSTWQVRMAIASLVEKGVLLKEHLFKLHHGDNYHPKNRTLYYAIQYDKLQKLAQEAESTEKFRFVDSTKQVCDCPQNRSNNTYKENKKATIQVAAAEVEKLVKEKPVTKERAKSANASISSREGADGKEKGLKRLELPKIELNLVNSENNRQLEATPTNPVKDQKTPHVDEKVNQEISTKVLKPKIEKIRNADWRSHLSELEKLGVAINKTVISLVKLYKTDLVERALAVFRNRKEESNIANPAGYFVQALKQNWGATTVATTDSEDTLDTQDLFRVWFTLARELGYCADFADDNGEKLVNMNGSWETWESAMLRGYSLEYLKKVRRRNN